MSCIRDTIQKRKFFTLKLLRVRAYRQGVTARVSAVIPYLQGHQKRTSNNSSHEHHIIIIIIVIIIIHIDTLDLGNAPLNYARRGTDQGDYL